MKTIKQFYVQVDSIKVSDEVTFYGNLFSHTEQGVNIIFKDSVYGSIFEHFKLSHIMFLRQTRAMTLNVDKSEKLNLLVKTSVLPESD